MDTSFLGSPNVPTFLESPSLDKLLNRDNLSPTSVSTALFNEKGLLDKSLPFPRTLNVHYEDKQNFLDDQNRNDIIPNTSSRNNTISVKRKQRDTPSIPQKKRKINSLKNVETNEKFVFDIDLVNKLIEVWNLYRKSLRTNSEHRSRRNVAIAFLSRERSLINKDSIDSINRFLKNLILNKSVYSSHFINNITPDESKSLPEVKREIWLKDENSKLWAIHQEFEHLSQLDQAAIFIIRHKSSRTYNQARRKLSELILKDNKQARRKLSELILKDKKY